MEGSRRFGSRFGFIVSMMGIAIGAGNIWRFPRIVAQNHSGAFLVAWLAFLFVWSIPLIITELSLGKLARSSPIKAFANILGEKFVGLGGFITVVTTCIAAYYSVVVGWGFSYFTYSMLGSLSKGVDFSGLWEGYQKSFWPVAAHLFSTGMAYQIVRKGVVNGVERCNRILIPAFFVCLLFFLLQALSLPQSFDGMKSLFRCDFKHLLQLNLWIEALSQNAWDTGAGWGLLFVYAGFARKKETIVLDGIVTAVLNNIVSLLMAVVIFSAASSLSAQGIGDLISGRGSSSLGLTFIYLPFLFTNLPGPSWFSGVFSAVFFLAFSMAALSSMISMLFLLSNSLEDLRVAKRHAVSIASGIIFILGVPSAISAKVFFNQDYVWGIALIINGLLMIFAAYKYGLKKLVENVTNSAPKDIRVGNKFIISVKYIIPLLGIGLLLWYVGESLFINRQWWNPFFGGSFVNLLFQWGGALVIILCLSPVFRKMFNKN
ncbi:sodium-dependent transporter [Chlamydiifrater phoenicopteri]|uniref:sodium-dependent transporter n=1 Tax=Chlamydiifrater phoenicopteri TaxID=2681469 RepID=UPI001BCF839C|nr:sodium-dependent transporter [Chlamydiifrater phoenicopteri]